MVGKVFVNISWANHEPFTFLFVCRPISNYNNSYQLKIKLDLNSKYNILTMLPRLLKNTCKFTSLVDVSLCTVNKYLSGTMLFDGYTDFQVRILN